MDSEINKLLGEIMLSRLLLTILLTLSFSTKAWACSCGEWSGFVSDFTEDYISVWAVPLEAKVNVTDKGRFRSGVTYKLHVLDGFERVIKPEIEVKSNVEDGGSCGVQLRIGLPQLINAFKAQDGEYGVSTCTPHPPYNALKLYLETGQDTYIPTLTDCYDWTGDGENNQPIFKEDLEECEIWKDKLNHVYYYGDEDLRKYRQTWWDKISLHKSK